MTTKMHLNQFMNVYNVITHYIFLVDFYDDVNDEIHNTSNNVCRRTSFVEVNDRITEEMESKSYMLHFLHLNH
jgi:hypothetical protein